MTVPALGETHNIVLHFSDTVACGLIVHPHTYRVNIAPQYIPRLGDADPRGIDKARWRSFIQDRFDGGSGLAVWDELTGPDKYASGSFIDVNPIYQRGYPSHPGDVALSAAAIAGVMPMATSAESGYGGALNNFFTDHFQGPFILEMSSRPHMFQRKAAYLYTNQTPTNITYWPPKPSDGRVDLITGEWVELETYSAFEIQAAVNFSNCIIVGDRDEIKVFGEPAGGGPSAFQANPVYSTGALALANYDDKLWRGYFNYISYLNPATDSADSQWSDKIFVGRNGRITNMLPFNGLLYVGMRDALWVYSAGTTYEVEDFRDHSARSNFAMMLQHQGSMYFNVRNAVYRLSSGGTLEKLRIPAMEGDIVGGTTCGREVIFSFDIGGSPRYQEVWIFDPETGGARKWFNDDEGPHNAYGAYSPVGLQGQLYLAPLAWTHDNRGPSLSAPAFEASYIFPVVAVSRILPGRNDSRDPETMSNTHFITPKMSMGFPNQEKVFNRIIVDAVVTLSADESIDVYYYTGPYDDLDEYEEVWQSIPLADWNLLGTITDIGKTSLSFPDNTIAESIILKFVMNLDTVNVPIFSTGITSYEIEYALAPSNLRTYDFTIIADDNVELLNLQNENSGLFVARTLYSCAVSPRTFVLEMPWPTHHTVRGLVTIVNPGGAVPAIVHDAFDGGDIPVHVDEM